MFPSLPLLSWESSVSVKENPDRKKKKEKKMAYIELVMSVVCSYTGHNPSSGTSSVAHHNPHINVFVDIFLARHSSSTKSTSSSFFL